jgi:hypothetical protein
MPPKAAAEVAVLALTAAVLPVAVLLLLLLAPAAAAGLLELDELLAQPAASKMEPTAAAVATIALDARKVNTLPLPPLGLRGDLGILARQVVILANQPERKVSPRLTSAIRLIAICADAPGSVAPCQGPRLARQTARKCTQTMTTGRYAEYVAISLTAK